MTRGCGNTRERLHDLLDDTLGEAERRRIQSHIEGCEGCAGELAALQDLKARVGQLPRELRPPSDLWPSIEPRLQLPWWRRLLPRVAFNGEIRHATPFLASGAALLALGFGLWLWRSAPATTASARVPVEASSQSAESLQAQAELARSEDGVLLARRDLLEAVQRQRDHLPPETVTVLEENMRIIDQAIGQIRSALEEDPLNQQLRLRLAARYQQEADLLKRVSRV